MKTPTVALNFNTCNLQTSTLATQQTAPKTESSVWKCGRPLLGTFSCLEPSHLKPFAWNLGTSCILYLEPQPRNLPKASLGTCLEPLWNLCNPLLGTLAWTFKPSEAYLELWNRNLLEPLSADPAYLWPRQGGAWDHLGCGPSPFLRASHSGSESPKTAAALSCQMVPGPAIPFFVALLLDPLLGTLTWTLRTFTWNP